MSTSPSLWRALFLLWLTAPTNMLEISALDIPARKYAIEIHIANEKGHKTVVYDKGGLCRKVCDLPYSETFERKKYHSLLITECYHQRCDRACLNGQARRQHIMYRHGRSRRKDYDNYC